MADVVKQNKSASNTVDTTQVQSPKPLFLQVKKLTGSLESRARSCPVSWTDKLTSDQRNPIIWCWEYIAELLASVSGLAPQLQAGKLEARLQHFLNVMEISLLQTRLKYCIFSPMF